jgi:hypothetical protein
MHFGGKRLRAPPVAEDAELCGSDVTSESDEDDEEEEEQSDSADDRDDTKELVAMQDVNVHAQQDEEDEEHKEAPSRRARPPASPRNRKKAKSSSALGGELSNNLLLEAHWEVGQGFEVTQGEAKEYPGLNHGYYVLTSVPNPQKVTPHKPWPLRFDEARKRDVVDWDAICALGPKKAIEFYATAAYLGHTVEDQTRYRDELRQAMRESKTPSAEWAARLEVFVLPPQTRITKPVFVTPEVAKRIDNYNPAAPAVLKSGGQKRWPTAVAHERRNVYEDQWRLVFPQSLFLEHCKFLARKDAAKKNGRNRSRPSGSTATASQPQAPPPRTREQVLAEKLEAVALEFPNQELAQFVGRRKELITMLSAAAQAHMRGYTTIADLNNNVKTAWEHVAAMHDELVAQAPKDPAAVFLRKIDKAEMPDANNRQSWSIFMLAASMFDPDAAAAVAEAYRRVASTLPITADKDVGGR